MSARQLRPFRHECGCTSMHSEWVKQCPLHQAEFDAIHVRWNVEHTGRWMSVPATREAQGKMQ